VKTGDEKHIPRYFLKKKIGHFRLATTDKVSARERDGIIAGFS